jgi:putative phosphoribosyl transferase
MPFRDRREAGRALAERLIELQSLPSVVLALPRGGVVVGAEVAGGLGVPLDVLMVRKLPTPGESELALGAIGEDGVRVINAHLLEESGLNEHALADILASEEHALEQEVARYRAVRTQVPLEGHTVVLVDDGLTTGSTAVAAARVAVKRNAARVIVAVPASSREAAEAVGEEVDAVICLETPPLILALDEWYEDFAEISDDEVIALLTRATATDAGEGAKLIGGERGGLGKP